MIHTLPFTYHSVEHIHEGPVECTTSAKNLPNLPSLPESDPVFVVQAETLQLPTECTLPPPREESTETLQHAYQKLAAVEDSLTTAGKNLVTAEPEALFDIYSLLRLMACVAQEEREAAKTMRKAASAQARLATQQQIDLQRSAAYSTLAMGLTACAISVTMQVTNLTLSTTAKLKQDAIGKQLGLPEAQKAYAQEVKLDTANAKALNKTVTAADKQLVKALGAQEAETFKTNLSTAPEVTAARDRLTEAREQLVAAQEAFQQHPLVPENRAAVDAALRQVETTGTNYSTALKTQTTRYETLAKAAPGDTAALARATSARAYQLQEQAGIPIAGRNQLQETPATQHFNLIQAATQHDPAFKRWGAVATVSQASTQITGAIGQALNLSAQQIGQLQNAKGAEVGAVASKARAAADAAAAIFNQEAEVLKSILDMMKGILEAENQSMETILRA
ncbi:MAG: hypothetical protein IJV69_05490 [Kiritimatiellae bacterium]|nr:hypothetical protein [Kiritimatiellia bacterium]